MDFLITEFRQYTDWLPNWMVSVGLLVGAVLIGLAIHRFAFGIFKRLVEDKDLFWRSLVSRGRRPMRLTVLTFTVSFAAAVAPLADRPAEIIRHVLLLGFILVLGWVAKTALHIWMTVYLRRFKLMRKTTFLPAPT